MHMMFDLYLSDALLYHMLEHDISFIMALK